MRVFVVLCTLCLSASATSANTMLASWYASGTHMANGQRFDPNDPTIAAHKTLPFGTRLSVTNPSNGKSINVVVKDRGPFISGRSLDLSRGAAERLGFLRQGLARLEVRIVARGSKPRAHRE